MFALSTVVCLVHYFYRVNSVREATYKKTENLTLSSWTSALVKDVTVPSHFHCAAACLKINESCNAWKYDDDSLQCSMGKVRY